MVLSFHLVIRFVNAAKKPNKEPAPVTNMAVSIHTWPAKSELVPATIIRTEKNNVAIAIANVASAITRDFLLAEVIAEGKPVSPTVAGV